MISGHTTVYGLLGRPTRHSLSPALHNGWLVEHGIDGVYVAFEVPEDASPDAVTVVRELGLGGVNLTVPLKATVVDRCDELGPVARVARAVNVLVRDGDRVIGVNTDAAGFVTPLEAEHGPVRGRTAVVLGAGGAARAVAAGLCERGIARLALANRTVARAEEAIARLAERWPGVELAATPLAGAPLDGRDLLVVATSGGAADAVRALDPGRLADGAVWCDLNYWMDAPPGLDGARQAGLRTLDGLPMLVHQGALAFERWTGVRPDAASALARLRRVRGPLPNEGTS